MIPESNGKWTIGWGVTSRCDLSCPFCYSIGARSSESIRETSLREASAFLRNNNRNINSINFGTGESFLMGQFPELVKLCRSNVPEIQISVTTNGAIANHVDSDELMTIFAENIDELDVSIDFPEQKLHDQFRGKEGSWERAMKAIKIGQQRGMDLTIVMVAMPETLQGTRMEEMIEIARYLGVALRINPYMPTTGNFDFTLSGEELIAMLVRILDCRCRIRTSDPLIAMLLGDGPNSSPVHYRSLRILPDSRISPSTYLTTSEWTHRVDLKHLRLSEVRHLPGFRRWGEAVVPDCCLNCEGIETCLGGSRERRILWYGTLEERDPYCPKRLDSNATIPQILNRSLNSDVWQGPSIHLGYLPTIVCIPVDVSPV